MRNRLLFLLPLLLFLVMVIFFWQGLGRNPQELPSMLVDKAVPTFSAPSLDNNSPISEQELTGKVILLNVWASWCEACKIEHPLLIDLAKMNAINIYGLNYKDDREAAKLFLANGNPYQKVIYDPAGKTSMQFGVYGTPETFLIDKKGIVRYRYVGPITLEILEKDLLPKVKQLEREA